MHLTTVMRIALTWAALSHLTFASSPTRTLVPLYESPRHEFREGYISGRQFTIDVEHIAKRECGQGFGKSAGKYTDPGCTPEKRRQLCFDDCNFMGRAGGMRGGGGAEVGCRLACTTMRFKS